MPAVTPALPPTPSVNPNSGSHLKPPSTSTGVSFFDQILTVLFAAVRPKASPEIMKWSCPSMNNRPPP